MELSEIGPQSKDMDSVEARTPDLRLLPGGLAVERTVEVTPSLSTMSIGEFKAHVQALVERGDAIGAEAALNSLLETNKSLTIDQHGISHTMAELTVRVSGLSQELNSIFEKKRWVYGYIKDRQP